MKKYLYSMLFILVFLGIIDAGYLTLEHLQDTTAPCSIGMFLDCGKVLKSKYSIIFGLPLALIGLIHYSILALVITYVIFLRKRIGKYLFIFLTSVGLISSIYFVFLQLVVIKAICLYCMLSAIISFVLFLLAQITFTQERKRLTVFSTSVSFKRLLRPVLFLVDSEKIHTQASSFGELLGKSSASYKIIRFFYRFDDTSLEQKIEGVNFSNPVGLAAGFDYEARLTQILPSLGFGFQTVGTITNMSYKGNPPPRLGRLPKSKSLMVNKGFKNFGAKKIASKLGNVKFKNPVGVSIGRTNSLKLKTQKQSIDDITRAFITFEESKVNHSYYELNISCPNLYGDITFYPPKNLSDLLTEVDKLGIKRPIFVKMPIEKDNKDTLKMLEIISKHSPAGVIFGNLQKDRKNKALDQKEVAQFKTGNFSGKPTFERSNELIRLSFKHYRDRFVIIGCGGIFSGRDAYKKITLGATLVQLITGMIFEGPQLAAQINLELVDLLQKDGYRHISQATGSRN